MMCCDRCKAKSLPGIIGTPWCGKWGKCACHKDDNSSVGVNPQVNYVH